MASPAASTDPAVSPKHVDESLWWDSFVLLFEELDAAPLSSDLPDHLVKKIKSNHAWFSGSVTCFKAPNRDSRLALDSPQIAVGSRRLHIKPELKEAALRVSACLCLDEVQSYILINRRFELKKSVDYFEDQEFVHLILLQYYLERQCLLKCVRRIFVHALYMNNGSSAAAISVEALQLVHDGLERKLVSILHDLFSSVCSDKTEVDFTVLWVEETLIEGNLVLDILFLSYYDNFCSCKLEQWKMLSSLFKGILSGSFNVGKLAVSVEARNSFGHAKAQLLLILIETLDLEHLLQMVHDEVPFRQGCYIFSLSDIQEIDAVVSGFSVLGTVEAGPLILAWAVFICLLLSLTEKSDYGVLLEIDHIGYVRQAFEASPLKYLLDILRSETLRDSDGPVSGFLSILRTFISAFIASYDLAQQTGDSNLNMILDIICQIYHGEESLCMQFWDKDSFVDGPIRSLLYMLEREYPFHTVELVRLLSALSEGTWASNCVYNFLDKMSGITLPFKIPGGSSVKICDTIESHHPLHVPGVEGLIVPSGTRGHIFKIVDANVALVHWECVHSGVLLLLLRLAQEPHPESYTEVLSLTLLYRMVSFNTGLCFALLYIDKSFPFQAAQRSGYLEKNLRVDVVKIICSLVFKLIQDVSNAGVVAICINILAEMLKCAPSDVTVTALRSNLFRMEVDNSASGTWLLSGGLARMLLSDSGESVECFPLTTSVLDFTVQLVEKGAEDDMVSALVVYSLQYVLVNHMNWKSKYKYARWKVTLKVLKVMRSCIKAIKVSHKLGCMIRDILLYDSSVHNILCRIMCVSTQALKRSYVSHHFELKEIESLQLAVCSGMDIVYSLLAALSKEIISNVPAFVQTMLSSATRPIPLVTAAISLMSFNNSELQVAAARVLSMLCYIASRVQPFSAENVSLVPDAMQIRDLSTTTYVILDGEQNGNKDLLIPIFNLLTSAARYQPPLLVCMLLTEEEVEVLSNTSGDKKCQLVIVPVTQPLSIKKARSVDSILKYLTRTEVLIKSDPQLLLSILDLLKALWEGGIQYMQILERIRSSRMFWKNLSSVLPTEAEICISVKNLNNDETKCTGYRYRCQGTVLEIIARELFLQEKLLQDEISEQQTSASLTGKSGNRLGTEISKASNTTHLKDILSTWWESSIAESLIKSYSSSGYDNEVIHRAKEAVCMCVVHLVTKLLFGNAGSLSISLVEEIRTISNKLSEHPAFSALLTRYSSRGYSEGKELTSLVLNDLYYHLQGELEGREIVPGHFQELTHVLLELEIFQCNECNNEMDIWPPDSNVPMFDIPRLRAEFGIEHWDYSEWKASKEVAERMFLHMHEANLIMFITYSKHLAMKALIAVTSLYEGNISRTKSLTSRGISEPFIESSIRYLCKCLQATGDSLIQVLKPPEDLLKLVSTQAELLVILSRILFRKHLRETNMKQFLPLSILVTRTSALVIKFLADIRPSTALLNETVKLLLMLLLTSLELCYPVADKSDLELNLFGDASLTSVGLLPVLFKYMENTEFADLSVASVDLMLKGFLALNTWLPILQKHLQLQLVVRNIQEKETPVSLPVILNFFLTMARVKGGAVMLHSANIFSSLKVLFTQSNDQASSNDLDESDSSSALSKDERHGHLRGLSLAIITSMIYSLGDDFSCNEVVDSAISYFFSENAYIMCYYLAAPTIPADDHSKKRARTQKTQTSLTALRLTEHTLMLMCAIARHQASWSRGMKEMESGLRETSIHLLAFISRGGPRAGDSPNRVAPPFCPPILQEEADLNGRPSFVNSRHGWFDLSALGIMARSKTCAAFVAGSSPVIKDRPNDNADLGCRTRFLDTVAIQMYKIAFLVLKFLCMQAKAAARRAEEMEFIDLAHFPELPMPEILHGLQDQTIAIVTEVCEASRSEAIQPEEESVCLLLLQILEKSLYLELCVQQSCGIRPVLGRIEDFSKETKRLMQVVEQHTSFKASVRSLTQIIAPVYPGLLDR